MKNAHLWQPTKFEFHRDVLRGSRNSTYLNPHSRLIMDAVARWYQQAFKEHVHGHLLDLGCGTVPFYAAYEPYIVNNICVDWSKSLHDQQYLDQECDLTRPLPFESEIFDTILLSDVLEHIPNPTDLWTEMARLLRPRGKILLNVPFYYWIHEEPYDFYRYTEFALRRFAEKSSLKVVTIESIGGLLESLADLVAKGIYRLPILGTPTSLAVQTGTAIFGRTMPGRKLFAKTRWRYPLGYVMVAEK